MKKVCQELIDFFQNEEGWDKNEMLAEYCNKVLEENGCIAADSEGDPMCGIAPDEIALYWGNTENDALPICLQDFAEALYQEILDGVCNVIATA